uniref:Secreted protein n=1 Tax=Setaria digitata TaxID=48799 RepID=A0A915PLS7_9BILA
MHHVHFYYTSSRSNNQRYFLVNTIGCILLIAIQRVAAVQETVPAVRVVRFQVDYPNASLESIQKVPKWNAIMRNSVLASLRFINKHWLICGGSKSEK